MQTVQLEFLDAEEEAAKNAKVAAENAAKEFERIVAANLAAGHPVPEVGYHLFVSTRSVPRRSRSGITFGRDRLHLVVVQDPSKPGELPSGAIPISARQAHLIINDNELSLSSRSATDVEAASLRTENAKLKAELAKLQRDARAAADPDPNGGPARLKAARAVGATGGKPDPEDFGSKG